MLRFTGIRTRIAALALAVVGTAGIALAAQPVQAADEGRVRIMHASPDTPAVDIFVNGQKAVTALAFPKDTGYISLAPGAYNVKVFPSPSNGTGAAALEANLTVAANKDVTVLAVGQLTKNTLALLPLEDNNGTPAAGKAHVRLIHASPDAPAVDVAVAGTNTKVFSNVAFKGVGTYTPVDAGTYNLEVRVAPSGPTALSIPGLKLDARTVYTVVAVGLVGDGSLKAIPLVDAKAPAAPSVPTTGTGLAAGGSSTSTATILAVVAGLMVIGSASVFAAARSRSR